MYYICSHIINLREIFDKLWVGKRSRVTSHVKYMQNFSVVIHILYVCIIYNMHRYICTASISRTNLQAKLLPTIRWGELSLMDESRREEKRREETRRDEKRMRTPASALARLIPRYPTKTGQTTSKNKKTPDLKYTTLSLRFIPKYHIINNDLLGSTMRSARCFLQK